MPEIGIKKKKKKKTSSPPRQQMALHCESSRIICVRNKETKNSSHFIVVIVLNSILYIKGVFRLVLAKQKV